MSILVNRETKIVVQGITGREGGFHTLRCMEYGTNIVAGVTPGKGGLLFDDRVPVFDSVEEAVAETAADTSLLFVPAPYVQDAVLEAAEAKIKLIVSIAEGVPVLDTARALRFLRDKDCSLLGPNCPGVISPGEKCKLGIMPGPIHLPGRVGVVSRSGTLTYEAVSQLTRLGIGQSTCVGIGGDPLIGTNFIDILKLFNSDSETDAVVLIGEIGGTMEQDAAQYIKDKFSKPVIAFIAGATAPPGKRMGHAGAIITGTSATASAKNAALESAGAFVVSSLGSIGEVVQKILGR
ncbi:succinate--CoA ligase subunit alpha [SAR202 cluster bacterium AD-804-J14_MRT_500m]|nr:succinate--CoA ligase subunit alpha [SAR202 cluster bacterium AD-804-J14_MRT_500m]